MNITKEVSISRWKVIVAASASLALIGLSLYAGNKAGQAVRSKASSSKEQ